MERHLYYLEKKNEILLTLKVLLDKMQCLSVYKSGSGIMISDCVSRLYIYRHIYMCHVGLFLVLFCCIDVVQN